jgi:hypothetical protein
VFPPLLAPYPEVVGLFVGGCVERGVGSSFRHRAHAHNHSGDPWFGWVCVRGQRRLLTASGGLSQIVLHEVAHILTPDHGHDDVWRAKARSIGYRLPAHYQKRTAAARGPTRTGYVRGDGAKFLLEGSRGRWTLKAIGDNGLWGEAAGPYRTQREALATVGLEP